MLESVRKVLQNPATPAIACVAGVLTAGSLCVAGAFAPAALIFGLAALVTIVSTVLNYPVYNLQMKKLMSLLCALMMVFYCADLVLLGDALTQPEQAPRAAESGHTPDSGYEPDYEPDYAPDYEPDYEPDYAPEPHDEPECGACNGTNRCSGCDGRGGQHCVSCNSGYCKYCHGSGKSSSYGVESRCGACNGRGRCTLCDGHGFRECGICHGSGLCKYCY